MKRCLRIMAMCAIALAFPRAASAQWFHQKGEDDPFAGGVTHMALTMSDRGEGILFRCTSIGDLALLYISIEKPDPAHAQLFSSLRAKLLVIVDDDQKVEFDADIDTTPDGDRYRFTATNPDLSKLARRTAGAKKRLAVAVELLGKRLYSTAVNVRGSSRALTQLATGCNLP